MDNRLANFYLESCVKNASPGQLLIMLYDGLVQQAEKAESELAAPAGSPERQLAAAGIARCIDFVTELTRSLRPEHDPELCSNLNNLYRFFAFEFSQALIRNDARKVTAILPLLRSLRAAWAQAQKTAGYAQAAAA